MLDDLLAQPAFALIRVRDADTVTLVGGPRTDVETLGRHPAGAAGPAGVARWDHLVLVPFAQVRERGFEAHQDGTPLSVIEATVQRDVPLDELLAELPDTPIELADRGGFETSDDDYADMVRHVIDEEIGSGEGANLVIGRHYRARVADWGHERALAVFRRLLERERGAFWTFCIFTGDRYLIGASPERHVSIEDGQVRMNPISGTFRMRGLETHADRKRELLRFLADEKEIYELFMVVDEELKMMCDICHEGGLVLGPYLKPMSHLVHTEYLLAGRTRRDVREVLRDSMFAATVTGSPVENACRLIAKYEQHGRGYYASVAALIGRDDDGLPIADAPILIRTADVDLDGNVTVTAGATLVRDSDPALRDEGDLGQGVRHPQRVRSRRPGAGTVADRDRRVHRATRTCSIALGSRNQRLSQFWLTDQSGTPPVPSLVGKRVVVLDGEDDFVNMLSHVLGVLGMTSDVVRHDAYRDGDLDGYDLVVVGPGPGRPSRRRRHQDRDADRRRRARLLEAAPPVPRRLPRSPGAEPAARARPRVQGHRLPGHAEPAHGARPAGDRGLLQHVRGPGARWRTARRRHRRGGRGDRRHPPAGRAALPRRAVPRRVDPDPERLPHPAGSGDSATGPRRR